MEYHTTESVMIPSLTKLSEDLGPSYTTMVLLSDVHRAALYVNKQATDGAGVV